MVHEVTSFDESFLMRVQEQTAFVPHVWVEVTTAEAKEIVYCLRSFLPEELEVKSANVFPIDLNVKVHLQVEYGQVFDMIPNLHNVLDLLAII